MLGEDSAACADESNFRHSAIPQIADEVLLRV
jgi:hypothetical protein